MDKIFNKRKKDLQDFYAYLGKKRVKNNQEIPDDIYTKCKNCDSLILTDDLNVLGICPECGYHHPINTDKRLELLFNGKYKEYFKKVKLENPLQFPGYEEKLEQNQKKTGLKEAVSVVIGNLDEEKVVTIIMDKNFMMASMGSVVGEKIASGIELARKKQLPLIIFCASGGARMQEGLYSLMQMAKVNSVLKQYKDEGGLYISYLTYPTMGGVTASFAMLGDINIAEPQALIGFAGQRVISSTIKKELPEGFQSAEFLLEHGYIDMIVTRDKMKDTLTKIIKMHRRDK